MSGEVTGQPVSDAEWAEANISTLEDVVNLCRELRMARAALASAAVAERERIRAVLREHYLTMIICDHENKLDNPGCACSRVFLGWHPTVAGAADAWIAHALAVGDDE